MREESTVEIIQRLAPRTIKEYPYSEENRYRAISPCCNYEPRGGGYTAFGIHADGNKWKCWACGAKGGPGEMRRLLNDPDRYVPPLTFGPPTIKKGGKAPPIDGATLADLSNAKNLPVAHLKSLGWHETLHRGKTVIGIPYPNGLRYRVSVAGEHRFEWQKGMKDRGGVTLYDPNNRLEEFRRGGWVLLVEGETDVAAGRLMGLPVIGVPGASIFKQEWVHQFQGCQIYAWQEPDQGGETLVKKLAEAFWDINVLDAPDGIKDLCDLHDQAGEGARDFFTDLRAEAKPNRDYLPRTTQPERDVQISVKRVTFLNANLDILEKDRGLRPGLWKKAEELFPYPSSIEASGKRVWLGGKGYIFRVLFKSRNWHNPTNAQYMRRLLFWNLFPKLNSCSPYFRQVPFDDWSEKYWNSLKKKIKRRKGECVALHNTSSRGYMFCVTNVALPGWKKMEHDDIEALLVDALKAIEPGAREPGERFHGYLASHGWSGLSTGEKISNELEILAVEDKPIDDIQVEAELTASGISYEYRKPLWKRSQGGQTLAAKVSGNEEAVRFLQHLGLTLTKKGRSYLPVAEECAASSDAEVQS